VNELTDVGNFPTGTWPEIDGLPWSTPVGAVEPCDLPHRIFKQHPARVKPTAGSCENPIHPSPRVPLA
jgi:hypothetical protein